MRNIVITGASRGLGNAFSIGVPNEGDQVWLVSRGEPASLERHDGVRRHWIRADLSDPRAAETIAGYLVGTPLDVLLYNAGIWESTGFSPDYDFGQIPVQETLDIIAVNLTSALLCTQALLPNMMEAENARIILVGSTSGLPNNREQEIAYNASKFGLWGMAQALRTNLRAQGIPVTMLNPGSINTSTPYDEGVGAALSRGKTDLIPMHDLVALVRCVLSLSPASCVAEITVPAVGDLQV